MALVMAQFMRLSLPERTCIDWLGYGARERRTDGEYREISVQEMNTATVEQLSLGAYDFFGKHIRIQDPGRPFSVHPAACWEPQSAIFTASHDYLERLGLFVSLVMIVFGSHTLAETRRVSFGLKLITRHLEWISWRMMRL